MLDSKCSVNLLLKLILLAFLSVIKLDSYVVEGKHIINDIKDSNVHVIQEKNNNLNENLPNNIQKIRNMSTHMVPIQLMKENEIKRGELSDSNEPAPDVVLKYDTGMFGLTDTDPTLHVWRAPFATFGEIWPQPVSVSSGKDVYLLCEAAKDLTFHITGISNYILEAAVARYNRLLCTTKMVSYYPQFWRSQEARLDTVPVGGTLLVPHPNSAVKHHQYQQTGGRGYNSAVLKAELRGSPIRIHVVAHGKSWPSISMNESYQINVGMRGIDIHSQETWGAIRALESLSQLAWRTRSGRVFLNETIVRDHPRFPHRGLMLDTARHFIPKHVLLRNIDAMTMHKLNVFHWHISDDQSFPLVTDNHPEFAQHAAYDSMHKVYTPDDVREIIEYARARGVRVIPELDMPSHSLSWRKSHPEMLTRCLDTAGRWTGQYGPLHMGSDASYQVLAGLLGDVVRLFPDQRIHLGSDEVASGCIESNNALRQWMRRNRLQSVDALVDLFLRRVQNMITGFGKKDPSLQRNFIVWQEAYDRNSALKPGTIVQLWKSQSTNEAATLARQGVSVIYSACWYLDRLEYGAQWMQHYACDPGDEFGGSGSGNMLFGHPTSSGWRKFVLGGEACMWTEFFGADNVLPRIWPLTGAAAERLWSLGYINNAERAAPRLEEMRCRMLLRGIPTGVASGSGNCGQDSEESLPVDPHTGYLPPFTRGDLHLSAASSSALIGQLIHNILSNNLLPPLFLLVAAFLCIYLRMYIHTSTHKMMVFIASFTLIYVVIWILTQPSASML